MKKGLKKIKKKLKNLRLYIFNYRRMLTIKKIFKVLDIKMPVSLFPIRNNYVPIVTMDKERKKYRFGSVFFQDVLIYPDAQEAYEQAKLKGAAFCFLNEKIVDESADKIPYFVVNTPNDYFVKLCRYMKKKNKINTICVTGSTGKTSSKTFVYNVISSKFNTLQNLHNSNIRIHVGEYVQKIKPEHKFYVQEVGGCVPCMVEDCSKIADADVFVVTNIGNSHVEKYGSVENIQKDKLSFDKHMKKSGVAVLNYDDERLKKAKLKHKVISYAIDNKDAMYRAINIEQKDEYLEMDVVYKNKKEHVRINAFGKHNAYNVLIGFAVGTHYKMTPSEIKKGLALYHPSGLRQNLIKIDDKLLYVDCFNAAYDSIKNALSSIKEIKIKEGAKKVAVIGDIRGMGEISQKTHESLGLLLNESDVEVAICFGEEAKYILNTIDDKKIKTFHTTEHDTLAKLLEENVNDNDLVLFKSSHTVHLDRGIDKAYGTTFYSDNNTLLKNDRSNEIFKILSLLEEGEIASYLGNEEDVVIENQYDKWKIVRICKYAFNKSNIKTLKVGKYVRTISSNAFKDCNNLESVDLKNVKYICENAFNNCNKLKELIINNKNCHIEKDAFVNCKNVELILPKDSKVINYAKENNIKHKIK